MKLVDLKLTEKHERLDKWLIEYLNLWGALKSHSVTEEDDVFKENIKRKLLVKLYSILIGNCLLLPNEDDTLICKELEVSNLSKVLELSYTDFEEKYLNVKIDFYKILNWYLEKIKIEHPSLYDWVIDYLNSCETLNSSDVSDNEYKEEAEYRLNVKLRTILIKSKSIVIKENDEIGKFIESLRKELCDLNFDGFEEKYKNHKFDFYAILVWFLDNYWI